MVPVDAKQARRRGLHTLAATNSGIFDASGVIRAGYNTVQGVDGPR